MSSQSNSIKVNLKNYHRIGRPRELGEKCRRIRVVCQTPNDKLKCLKYKHLLKRDPDHNKVFISNDLTKIQREKRSKHFPSYLYMNHGQSDRNEDEHNEIDYNQVNLGRVSNNEMAQSPLHHENVNIGRRANSQSQRPIGRINVKPVQMMHIEDQVQ